MDRLRPRKSTRKNAQELPENIRRSTVLEEIEMEEKSATSPRREVSTPKEVPIDP